MDFKILNIGTDPYSAMKGSAKESMAFSESVYAKHGIKILNDCGYKNINPTSDLAKYIAAKADGKMALDHFVQDADGNYASIQSRFRGKEYDYDDFTIRYDLPTASCKCEYYHLNAELFFYGRTDGSSTDVNSVSKITKWLLIDANKLNKLIKNKKIVPDPKIKYSKIIDNVLHCAIKTNTDKDPTRMIVVPTILLSEIAPDVILKSVGYPKKNEDAKSLLFKDIGIHQPDIDKSQTIYNNIGQSLLKGLYDIETVTSIDDFDKYLFAKTASKMNVNCHVKDQNNQIAGLLIRLRDPSAATWNDFTIRYDYKDGRYDSNIEYQNLNADLMFYAVCDNDINYPEEVTSFTKWMLINLAEVRKSIKNGIIIPITTKSEIKDDKLYCKIKENFGKADSRFITLDAKLVNEVNDKIIIAQKGYL